MGWKVGLLRIKYNNEVLYVCITKKKTSSKGMSKSLGPTITWLG